MDVDREFPDLTPVKHKTEGYLGWIDGITKMKEIFTGNTECAWQYRICVQGEAKKRIAPEGDIELNDTDPPLPTSLRESHDETSGYRKETLLHALGYQLTDMTRHQREEVLFKIAVPYLKVGKVLKTILDLIYTKKKKMEQSRNAVIEWNHDLDTLLNRYGADYAGFSDDLVAYALSVKKMLKNAHIVWDDKNLDILEQETERRKQKK